MKNTELVDYVKSVLENMPQGWVDKTTHRLDIYNEDLAKFQFLDQLETLSKDNNFETSSLDNLPTAYDYIRLGHPLSCLLEWVISKFNNIDARSVISFSSKVMPILAILRENLIDHKNTQIIYKDALPDSFDTKILESIYGYKFDLKKVDDFKEISKFNGSTIVISNQEEFSDLNFELTQSIDFFVKIFPGLGSVVLINNEGNKNYISEIQHVRRRETIAMTPQNCLKIFKALTDDNFLDKSVNSKEREALVLNSIKEITRADTKPLLGSSGLSIQYAILMGLIQTAKEEFKGKEIKIIVPPNCYGGTNDQARRVATCIEGVEIVDLPVDGDNDMVLSVDKVLTEIAKKDAVPYIIAEIPTNPRVEVPDLDKLNEALTKERKTQHGRNAIEPVFILDQTFCPNVNFLGEDEVLSGVKVISYVSGSKFPSGGKCTAGYCVANQKANSLMKNIEEHLTICDNKATPFQIEILAEKLPSMNKRIENAYKNTREFVDHIIETLPEAKINFVSEDLAEKGFTPSVFSLDLPTKGSNEEEREAYKRELNYKLINLMIKEIPDESKHCVSYGQLKGSYWTIPATSTQGTTKEGDKDYIVRVSIAPEIDIKLHKKVFLDFVGKI